jgi:hypothetical protein
MNAARINRFLEALFQGELPEPAGGPARFNWVDPKTGKKPPKPPKAMLPGKEDFQALNAEVPPTSDLGREELGTGQAVPIKVKDATDTEGRHSLNDLLPKSEMATIDHLLDVYLQMQKTKGPAAAKAWFDRYRTAEFESAIRKIVNVLLESETIPGEGRSRMPEDYYAQGERFHQAARRAHGLSKRNPGNQKFAAAAYRAGRRQTDHENEFGVDPTHI